MNQRSATRPGPETTDVLRSPEAIIADPQEPVAAAIQGAGGYGKSTLLARIAHAYRAADIEVCGAAEVLTRSDYANAAVLVDDAHHLDEATLLRLRELAGSGLRLVVALRPWPRPAALEGLLAALGRHGPVLRLEPLNRAEIAEQAREVLGAEARTRLVERLAAVTGGVPRLLTRLLDALSTHGSLDDEHNLPTSVFDHCRRDLEPLGARARGCLTALSVGATPHPAVLAGLLGADSTETAPALTELRAAGLVDSGDVPLPLVRETVVASTPWEDRLELLRNLVRAHLDRGAPVLPLVQPLLGTEPILVHDRSLAEGFEVAAGEAAASSPRLAVRLFDAAVSAGARPGTVAARRARAAAAAGDLDEALRTADEVIVDEHAPDRATAIQVSAAVLAHRGLLVRSAELCRWSAENVRWPGDTAYAVLGLIGSGWGEDAAQLLRSSPDAGPPTSLSGATAQLAEGVHESVWGSATTALATLVRAASLAEPIGRDMLVPDTPAAVAHLVAVHCGEFDVADSLVRRAAESGTGGPLLRTRHRLLSAWVPLLRGDTVIARAELDAALEGTDDGESLGARDRLTAVAIEAGIAHRDNDMAALGEARTRARRAVAEHPVDLYSLLPLGELIVAAARLRDQEWLLPYLREARTVLAGLGEPALWSAPLLWRCAQAAIVLEQHGTVREHAAALEGMAGHNPLAAALSGGASGWLRIFDGDIDGADIEQRARALHSAGLVWDGAGLAGQAALRTGDRKVMLSLLECARALQGKKPRPQKHPSRNRRAAGQARGTGGVPRQSAPSSEVRGDAGPPDAAADLLSDREREVAELVLAGMTYKQVGRRLFISAKTVEHHIGRIKQRLDCADREEMLTRLRALL